MELFFIAAIFGFIIERILREVILIFIGMLKLIILGVITVIVRVTCVTVTFMSMAIFITFYFNFIYF
jgi:hypothetical protein